MIAMLNGHEYLEAVKEKDGVAQVVEVVEGLV
jgi:hypothetical protein